MTARSAQYLPQSKAWTQLQVHASGLQPRWRLSARQPEQVVTDKGLIWVREKAPDLSTWRCFISGLPRNKPCIKPCPAPTTHPGSGPNIAQSATKKGKLQSSRQKHAVKRNCRLCDDQSTYLLSGTTNRAKQLHRQLHRTGKTPYAQRESCVSDFAPQCADPLRCFKVLEQKEQTCNFTDQTSTKRIWLGMCLQRI